MNKELIQRIFKTSEGNIFLLSIGIILCLLAYILTCYTIDPIYANKVTGIVFTNLFIGRVPALSFGFAAELSHFIVITLNIITEMILVTSIYSLFVFSYKGILKVKALEDFFKEVKKRKEVHQEKFDKYGKLGLFIFVFIPFWMTGPIVGSIIGFLIGMRHYIVISIVFIATVVSMTLWGLFLQEIIYFVVEFDARLIWILLVIVVIILIFLKFRRREKI